MTKPVVAIPDSAIISRAAQDIEEFGYTTRLSNRRPIPEQGHACLHITHRWVHPWTSTTDARDCNLTRASLACSSKLNLEIYPSLDSVTYNVLWRHLHSLSWFPLISIAALITMFACAGVFPSLFKARNNGLTVKFSNIL